MMMKEWDCQAQEILNLPAAERSTTPFNLALPRSYCPTCEHKIKALENIPLVSYMLLRGKCSVCKNPISLRYPMIELATGLLTGLVILYFGLTWTGLACCILTWALVALAFIDLDHQLLPDDITLPLIWMGLIINYFNSITEFGNAFWGAIAGYLSLWSVVKIFKLITGKDGMGNGDFKLLAVFGAWLGWQLLPLIIILSSLTGAIIGGLLILRGRDRAAPIPFGPFLAIAGFIALLWGNEIILAYLQIQGF